ncbi:hypothetical protein V2J09_002684 [Rumex salicifolius]
MIHGPCGSCHPNCPYMKQNGNTKKCKSKYPKFFSEFTTCRDDSYPVYKRRCTGEKIRIQGEWLDNRSENDCVSFNLIQAGMKANDEISSYQNARWISPLKAAWRIFGFHLYDIYPFVTPLQVHLPNMQSISFCENESLANIAKYEPRSRTMLTEFFENNRTSQNGEKYLYSKYHEHFVWGQSNKVWTIRKIKKIAIGRLAYAGPSEGLLKALTISCSWSNIIQRPTNC